MSSNTPVLWPIWIERGGGAVQGFKVQCRIDRNRALDVCKFLVETLHLGLQIKSWTRIDYLTEQNIYSD